MARLLQTASAFLLVLLAAGLVSAESSAVQWTNFKRRFNRKYASAHEEATRRVNFERNMAAAAKAQAVNPLATFGINHLSDKSEAEMRQLRGLARNHAASHAAARATQPAGTGVVKGKATPQQVDWRTKGAVTPVKNQGQCGDCWSFSTTGNIEGQWFLAGHDLVSLSEQELTSCDTVDDGCGGGLPWNAFGWLLNNTGGWITSEAADPFVSGSGVAPACNMNSTTLPKAAQITGFELLPANNEANMAAWVAANGPLSIGVDATPWQTYTGGILSNCPSTQLDHAVLIVGFDLSYSTPYWIIKNSWTAGWGEAGYIRVAYGSNQCGLAEAPSSAKVAKAGPAPPPPAPTPAPPVTPAPAASGNFTQYNCPDWTCLDGCSGNTLPLGVCLGMAGSSGSAVASCSADALTLQVYTTGDCSGSSTSQSEPLNQCLGDNTGTYVYNVCGGSGKSVRSAFRLRK